MFDPVVVRGSRLIGCCPTGRLEWCEPLVLRESMFENTFQVGVKDRWPPVPTIRGGPDARITETTRTGDRVSILRAIARHTAHIRAVPAEGSRRAPGYHVMKYGNACSTSIPYSGRTCGRIDHVAPSCGRCIGGEAMRSQVVAHFAASRRLTALFTSRQSGRRRNRGCPATESLVCRPWSPLVCCPVPRGHAGIAPHRRE